MGKSKRKLYWYVTYWRNPLFFRTRYKPNKIGSIFGVKDKYEDLCRKGFCDKIGNFRIVEKYAFIGYMSRQEFKKWIKDDYA